MIVSVDRSQPDDPSWSTRTGCYLVQLVDADLDARNPYVVQANVNWGNRQIAHGIDRVLRPVDL